MLAEELRSRGTRDNSRHPLKIGILGHVGNGNLGDEAIVASLIQNIRRRCPTAEIHAFTSNPQDTRERHRIAAFPVRRPITVASPSGAHAPSHASSFVEARRAFRTGLKAIPPLYKLLKWAWAGLRLFPNCFHELRFSLTSFRALKALDVLIIAGSGQLFDYFGGSWGVPYTLFKWSILAKASRARLVFLSVGAGPIGSPLSRFFIRYSLSLAAYRSYRDESSRKLIESIGVRGPHRVFPDLAFSLDTARSSFPSLSPSSARIVGINAMPVFADFYWPERDRDVYQNYLDTLASFALWLIGKGYRLLFFPTQLRVDPPVIAEIKARMRTSTSLDFEDRIVGGAVSNLDDLLSQIASTSIVVATRFHGALLSCLMRKPVLGISYHRKTDDLLTEMGQSEYVVDIVRLSLAALIDRFSSLEAKSGVILDQLPGRVADCRSALGKQYDDVLHTYAGLRPE